MGRGGGGWLQICVKFQRNARKRYKYIEGLCKGRPPMKFVVVVCLPGDKVSRRTKL